MLDKFEDQNIHNQNELEYLYVAIFVYAFGANTGTLSVQL